MKPSSSPAATAVLETQPDSSHGAECRPDLDGDRVAARRWNLNLSQAQLGKRLGCCRSRVCHLESGQPHRVTQQTLDNLADALKCAPADLLVRAEI